MKDYVAIIQSKDSSKELQLELFRLGYSWKSGHNEEPIMLEEKYIVIPNVSKKLYCVDRDEAELLCQDRPYCVEYSDDLIRILRGMQETSIDDTDNDPWIPPREQLVKYFMSHRLRP